MPANGDRVSLWGDENVPRLIVAVVAQHCECTECHELVHFMVGGFMCHKFNPKKAPKHPWVRPAMVSRLDTGTQGPRCQEVGSDERSAGVGNGVS